MHLIAILAGVWCLLRQQRRTEQVRATCRHCGWTMHKGQAYCPYCGKDPSGYTAGDRYRQHHRGDPVPPIDPRGVNAPHEWLYPKR